MRTWVSSVLILAMSTGGCSGSSTSTPATTPSTTSVTSDVTITAIATAAPATTTTAPQPTPFGKEDLPALVLTPEEGEGLADGLEFRPSYSGAVGLATVRHMTLVPPDRMTALGFIAARASTFFTDPFLSEWGRAGRSLVSLVLIFPTPEAAESAQRVFVDSFDEFWAEWQPLSPIQEGFPGASGLCGTDNTDDLYPTVGFSFRVGNTVTVLGSQGGAEQDEPLPEDLMRTLAEDMLARGESRLADGS